MAAFRASRSPEAVLGPSTGWKRLRRSQSKGCGDPVWWERPEKVPDFSGERRETREKQAGESIWSEESQ